MPVPAHGAAQAVVGVSDMRPRRSALYLPASNPRAIVKARGLPCDVVILDLEDAVAPDAKAGARAAAVAAVREGGFGRRELVVRVNALATPWGADDCAALAQVRPDAVLLPKIDDAASLAAYIDRLPGMAVWAMVETAASVLRLDAIAAAPGLAALVMGTNDLAKDMRARPRTRPVAAARFPGADGRGGARSWPRRAGRRLQRDRRRRGPGP